MSHYVFNDPIHGTMELHPLLVKLIDTPEFQRMRNIKQLGTAYYVYPGASNNRFEHCIGVSYLAGQLVEKLSQSCPHVTDNDKLCVQIAGLLHDLGHGPFSHLFDGLFITSMRGKIDWTHEQQSCNILDHILLYNDTVSAAFTQYNISDTDIVFIKEAINAKQYLSHSGKWLFKGRPREKAFLYEIIANERTGIDVDKFDYLLRDCHHLGLNCTLDWRRLVHMMRVVEHEDEHRIAIRDKEKDGVFNLFYLRMHLHRRAYQHKTTTSIDLMLNDVLMLCNDLIFPETQLSHAIHDIPLYLTLTDSITETIGNMRDEGQPGLKEAKALIHRIHTRRLYTCVYESPPTKNSFSNRVEILAALTEQEPCLHDQIALSVVKLNFGKWGPTGDPLHNVLFYDKSGELVPQQSYLEYSLLGPNSWSQHQLRVFCKSQDAEVIDKARGAAEKWVSSLPSPRVENGVE